MSKHTPGPWFKQGGFLIGSDGSDVVAAGLGLGLGADCGDGIRSANACLIAASPDLYAVLKELQESAAYWSEYDVPLGIVDRINQAIAKAEGA